MRRGFKITIIAALVGLALLIIAEATSPRTCSDLGCPETFPYDGWLFIVGVFLVGMSAVTALNAWNPRPKTS